MAQPFYANVEPLTTAELQRLRRTRKALFSMTTIMFTLVFAIFVPAMVLAGTRSWEETLFLLFIVGVILYALSLLVYGAVAHWRTTGATEKIVIRGYIDAIEYKTLFSVGGITWTLRVGDFTASSPLMPIAPGFLDQAKAGRPVEVAYLHPSGRTLSVVLL